MKPNVTGTAASASLPNPGQEHSPPKFASANSSWDDLDITNRVLEKGVTVWEADRPQWIIWTKQVFQSSQGMYGKKTGSI